MFYELSDGTLSALVSSKGGELVSLRDGGTEYLWQADPLYWPKHAPQLFPFLGRLAGDSYYMDGKKRLMSAHGFLRRQEMRALSRSKSGLLLEAKDTAETRGQYDRRWRILLLYRLDRGAVHIRFRVVNRDSRAMYFGYGGHPGFNVPLSPGLSFEDYRLSFPFPAHPVRIGLTPAGFLNGPDLPFPLAEGRFLFLRHGLFDRDAVIFRNIPRAVTLMSERDPRRVTLRFPDMPYLALWHTPRTASPFLCIEPWTSLPARQDTAEIFEEKSDLISLPPGKHYDNSWSVSVS